MMTRKAFFAVLLAPFVALKARVRPEKTSTAYAYKENGHTFYVMDWADPEILSTWTDPATGDLIVLALFPKAQDVAPKGTVRVTEVRFQNKEKKA